MMNPFGPDDQERLYNVATAKTASADTEKFLISVNVRREIAKKSFISECTKYQGDLRNEFPNRKCKHLKLNWKGKQFRDPMEKFLQPALCVTFLAVFCVFL